MARKRFSTFFLLLAAMFLMANLTYADGYWVAFNGIGGTFTYIMKIDSHGSVLVDPTPIFMWDPRFSCANCPSEPTNPLAGDGQGEDNIKGAFAGPRAVAMAFTDSTHGTLHMWQISSQGSVFHQFINAHTLAPTNGPQDMSGRDF